MKLPSADRAYVDPIKVRDYLLSPIHRVGRFKAAVFATAGYRRTGWSRLRRDLEAIARVGDARPLAWSVYGRKFAINGILHGPNGRALAIVSVWMIRRGESFPRFVTAYPETRDDVS
jgi:hypothetical protein